MRKEDTYMNKVLSGFIAGAVFGYALAVISMQVADKRLKAFDDCFEDLDDDCSCEEEEDDCSKSSDRFAGSAKATDCTADTEVDCFNKTAANDVVMDVVDMEERNETVTPAAEIARNMMFREVMGDDTADMMASVGISGSIPDIVPIWNEADDDGQESVSEAL